MWAYLGRSESNVLGLATRPFQGIAIVQRRVCRRAVSDAANGARCGLALAWLKSVECAAW
jgi:hypothetical protein